MSDVQAAQLMERGRLTGLQVTEPAAKFGTITPPMAFPVAPAFTTLATVTIFVDDTTDRVWLNGTVGWYASFTAVGTVEATFQILRGTTVVYQIRQAITSSTAIPAPPPALVYNIANLEHIDDTPVTAPGNVTYTLQAQASAAGAFTSGPVTLTAAEIEPNAVL
ncbi:hypothetical protein [Desulfotomaculum copahuensis]|uniref:Uncharacterized protein n=1 Tax=Desulfotomaculum copahuensis TaxID=1838280 RepID=A0A1B7LGW2_9FIRM|nr:hypothetical protein [Desulfotomaculum copahuensis]OAT85310.1 hypothetical protein A6M21_17340 [Desulfotomaculum copahuensis]